MRRPQKPPCESLKPFERISSTVNALSLVYSLSSWGVSWYLVMMASVLHGVVQRLGIDHLADENNPPYQVRTLNRVRVRARLFGKVADKPSRFWVEGLPGHRLALLLVVLVHINFSCETPAFQDWCHGVYFVSPSLFPEEDVSLEPLRSAIT